MREQPQFDTDERIGKIFKICSRLGNQLARDLTSVDNDILDEAQANGLEISMVTIDGVNHTIANGNDSVGQQFMKKKHLQIIFMENEDHLTVPYIVTKRKQRATATVDNTTDIAGVRRKLLQVGSRGRRKLQAVVEERDDTPNVYYFQPLQGPGGRA